ncbi:cold-shock protein, putative [Hepatocystis sp. ex Piliocolobus tephrosceles]|nr:cold-shock protein, putative [Hepatocystis sp. ex Piliocolobus tephrosceles]
MFKVKQSSTIFNLIKKRLYSVTINGEHCSKITGHVVKFDRRKGYGFIKPNDGGPEIFVHYTDISLNRSFNVTSDEKKKIAWSSSVNFKNSKDDFNYENEQKKKKEEIKSEFKYLIPGERVRFSVIYDQRNHSSKAVNVEFLD